MKRAKFSLVILLIGIAAVLGYFLWYPDFFDKLFPTPAVPSAAMAEELPPLRPLVGVMIENSPEARPQYGLSLADTVFETVTEGGITRMLALFQSSDVSRIGPVRSARPYYLNWAEGMGAVFAHSGGSEEALEQISVSANLKDVNEFYNEQYFWRDNSRAAPHNLYTSSALLNEFASRKGWRIEEPQIGWEILKAGESRDLGSASSTAQMIAIDFSFDIFSARYDYDPATKSYLRTLAGKSHKDALNGQQIAAKNVVVMYTESTVIDQKLLTIDLEDLGSGRAVVFRDGQFISARWRKISSDAPLELLDADGTKIALARGPTWFAILDQHGTASWK